MAWKTERAGKHSVSAAIDGDALLGAPFFIYMQAGTPAVDQTEVACFGLETARAGEPFRVMVTLRDIYGNAIKPSRRVRFGMMLLPRSEKARRKKHKSEPFEGRWIGGRGDERGDPAGGRSTLLSRARTSLGQRTSSSSPPPRTTSPQRGSSSQSAAPAYSYEMT